METNQPERRSYDARIIKLETYMEGIRETIERIEVKLDRYNGVREKLDNVIKRQDNSSKHIMGIVAGIVVCVMGLVMEILIRGK